MSEPATAAPRAPKARKPKKAKVKSGESFFCIDAHELQFIYDEIFGDNLYVRHGIEVPEDAVVFDVGANIGIFSLWVAKNRPKARVFAFEPLPPIHDALEANLKEHGAANVRTFRVGLAPAPAQARFTFYPLAAGWSTMFPNDTPEVRAAMRANLRGNPHVPLPVRAMLATPLLGSLVGNLIVDTQLKHDEYDCQLRTLSDVLREVGVDRIDLLKVDVERAELGVLQGISDEDWPKVRQVTMEVQSDLNRSQRQQVRALLESKGFQVHEEDIDVLRGADGVAPNSSLYARRP